MFEISIFCHFNFVDVAISFQPVHQITKTTTHNTSSRTNLSVAQDSSVVLGNFNFFNSFWNFKHLEIFQQLLREEALQDVKLG